MNAIRWAFNVVLFLFALGFFMELVELLPKQ